MSNDLLTTKFYGFILEYYLYGKNALVEEMFYLFGK